MEDYVVLGGMLLAGTAGHAAMAANISPDIAPNIAGENAPHSDPGPYAREAGAHPAQPDHPNFPQEGGAVRA